MPLQFPNCIFHWMMTVCWYHLPKLLCYFLWSLITNKMPPREIQTISRNLPDIMTSTCSQLKCIIPFSSKSSLLPMTGMSGAWIRSIPGSVVKRSQRNKWMGMSPLTACRRVLQHACHPLHRPLHKLFMSSRTCIKRPRLESFLSQRRSDQQVQQEIWT